MARYRKKRELAGKMGVKHSDTLVGNIGNGSATVLKQTIINTDAGARIESSQVIQGNATTSETCRTGDCVKFVNSHIQCASRNADVNDNMGWIEYAYVWKRESEADLTTAQTGVLTLGNIATNRYRNDCIWTGFIPIGRNWANGVSVKLKMPKIKKYFKIGEEFVLFVIFRSNNSTNMGTDSNRIILSYNYKAYS